MTGVGSRPHDAGAVKEIRIALVCYGGVSLAIYMHGITKEIHKLVKASDRFGNNPQENPFPLGRTEHVYWNLLRQMSDRDMVRTRVVTDVISGTSAGGINGVFLGKALAHDLPQDALRDLWLTKGDLGKLLRGPRFLPARVRFLYFLLDVLARTPLGARPPLRGDEMCRWLYDALAEMDQGDHGSLVPSDQSLELFVTVTDIRGYRRYVPVTGRLIADRTHRGVLQFTFDHAGRDCFGDGHNGALAFAARATSSFPGAFPPVSIADFSRFLGPRRGFDGEAFSRDFFPEYTLWGERAEDTHFLDGGVLDNFPFEHAIGAIVRKPASTEVDRWLLYIEPDPADPPPKRRRWRGRGPSSKEPSWLGTIWSALSGIPRLEPIGDGLLRLRAFNEKVSYISDLTATHSAEVEACLNEVRERIGADLSRASQVRPLTQELHERARQASGSAYATYVQLKLQAVSRDLASMVAGHFGYPRESAHAGFVRSVLRAWIRARHPFDAGEDAQKRVADFLGTYDLQYGERRLRFVIQGVNELYAEAGGRPEYREELDTAKRALYELLGSLRAAAAPVAVAGSVGGAPFQLFDATRVSTAIEEGRDPAHFADEHAEELSALVDAIGRHLDAELAGFSERLWERFDAATQGCPGHLRRALLVRFLGFPLWDTLIFPVMSLSEVAQMSPIRVGRISPDDATLLSTPGREKLKGVAVHHFGAFFDRGARENDYLW